MSHARPPEPSSRPSGRSRTLGPLLAWTAFLAGALAVLHSIGGPLAPPPLTDPAGWKGWLEGREPSEAAVAVVRLMVLAMAWYLLAVTLGGTLARLAGTHLLVRAADAVTVPLVRRLVGGALGVSVAAASLTSTASAATNGDLAQPPAAAADVYHPPPAPGAELPPTMQRLPVPPAGPAGSFRATIPPPGPPPAGSDGTDGTTRVTTPAPPPPPAGTDSPAPPPAAPPAGTDAPAPSPAAPPPTTWTVRPGDHFWSVAEQVLAEAWGRAPSDREVDPYWRSLVEANRPILRDPANADLLFPDQVIQVPPPPPAPGPAP